jgi:hypothetical protein
VHQILIIFGIAIGVAFAIVITGAAFVRQTMRILAQRFEQQVQEWRRQKQEGTLSEYMLEVDLDSLKPENMGFPVSPGLQRRLDLAMFMKHFWYVLIPLAVAFCIVVADILRLILSYLG